MRSLWDLLFLHFFFTRDILTLISASASASDSDLEEDLSELEELFLDSDEEVSLLEESESDCSSTITVWTRSLLDFFFFLDLFFDFFFFVLEVLRVSLRPLLFIFLTTLTICLESLA